MSTRGLYGYIENGEYSGNYNHSDSYPSGLGTEFLTACKNKDFSGFGIEEDAINFIKDSLFCEWAYFYNKDTDEFEVWKGFQKQPYPENLFGQEQEDGYYPCKLIYKDKIENIPLNIFDDYNNKFLKMIDRDKKINNILNDTNT